jgi:hypothetical protein
MSATIIDMEEDYRFVDVLNADQLEVGDLIGLGIAGVVRIISIDSTLNGFSLVIENEFSEKEDVEILDNEKFELFIENF